MMKQLALLLLFVLPSALQAETNYCHDPKTNQQWQQIKRNHRGEQDVEALAALRERLCREVDAGKISVREATERFEAERKRVIQKRNEYNREQEGRSVEVG
jgi:hypothetical protein